MLSELDAFNLILSANGDAPIASIEGSEWIVGLIRPHFEKNRRTVLSLGLASNVDKQTLAVDADDNVVVPTNFLKVRFPAGMDHVTVRNGYVWDRSTQTNHAESIDVLATLDLEFEQLDEITQEWIVNLSARDFRLRQSGEYDSKCAFYDEQARGAKMRAINANPASSDALTGWGATQNAYSGR